MLSEKDLPQHRPQEVISEYDALIELGIDPTSVRALIKNGTALEELLKSDRYEVSVIVSTKSIRKRNVTPVNNCRS